MKVVSKLAALLEAMGPQLDQDIRMRAALSFFNANTKEKKRRLEWIRRMSAEYESVCDVDRFGTGLMIADMEKVIDGDFVALGKDAHFWLYEDEHEDTRERYSALHAAWKKLIDEYVAESEASLAGLGDA